LQTAHFEKYTSSSGGAGGVGSIAIQYAKSKGFHVTTTASPGEKTELCTSLGADMVIDYKSNKFESMNELKDQFDLCFDCTGESGKMIELVKSGGRIVTINAHESGITFECLADILERNGKSAGCLMKCFVKSKLKFTEFIENKIQNIIQIQNSKKTLSEKNKTIIFAKSIIQQ
jgi:NADPH:quinone reductase-like Zn-dependent oxidoreductase